MAQSSVTDSSSALSQQSPDGAKNPFAARRKRRGERLIERGIRIIAGAAISLIFLILVFVLREALSLWGTGDNARPSSKAAQSSAQAETDLKPEIYNPDITLRSADAQTAAAQTAAPKVEVYNPDATLEPNAPDTAAQTKTEEAPKVEVYNPDATLEPNAPDTAAQPQTREAPRPEPSAELRPEVYNPDVTLAANAAESKDKTAAAQPPETPKELSLWENFLGSAWQPVSERPKFGVAPLIVGTAKTTFVAIALGAPIGILAALYAAFLAPKRLREYVKPMVEILAGFPSVVIGFFCLLFVGSLTQQIFGLEYRLNAFVGGIGLAIAVIPIVFTITEDALSAVPKTLLEAALAMGATTWEAAYKVMLPAAFPGVFAAVLLGVGRAFGETMIALMATGNASLLSAAFTDPARTLAATIGAEMGEVVWGSTHYGILFLLGILLFVVSFTLNAVTEFFVKERLAKRLQGK